MRRILGGIAERAQHVLVGFDLPYGYTAGFASALGIGSVLPTVDDEVATEPGCDYAIPSDYLSASRSAIKPVLRFMSTICAPI